uniref:Uncharacterized protein n=1 Tax=Anguilla anguilla TaxID=7936 RepID=A0A0E9UTY6_ANGAN
MKSSKYEQHRVILHVQAFSHSDNKLDHRFKCGCQEPSIKTSHKTCMVSRGAERPINSNRLTHSLFRPLITHKHK